MIVRVCFTVNNLKKYTFMIDSTIQAFVYICLEKKNIYYIRLYPLKLNVYAQCNNRKSMIKSCYKYLLTVISREILYFICR